ncbi:hypothetical protein KRX52_07220 [Pseudomonas sp. MAP12]|uniref:DUF7673 domain-containing protein n=1 Tax=Geopseudomonas aromaticivorans TaxID=2849492 RepID=A0ABS6MUV8_9GAMM|nr:hypothetical protein [Pseudomonas aromaticivorans]MBV2132594.1 hypothetical protein [Pseudomonas aromaticivorans]
MNRDIHPLSKRLVIDIKHARRARDEAEIERAISVHIEQHNLWCSKQKAMIPHALEALVRLLDTALHGSGDARHICKRFLLGLRDGRAHRFNMSKLRHLDIGHWQDCMAVLGLYQYSLYPIDHLIEDGELLWKRLEDQ